MPAITIKNIPFDIQQQLEMRAIYHKSSPDIEALALLEQVLGGQTEQQPYKIPPVKPYKPEVGLTQQWLTKALHHGRE